MYELVENLLMVAMAIIGVLFIIAPKGVVKESVRQSKGKLLATRIAGVFVVIGAVVVLLISFDVIKF